MRTHQWLAIGAITLGVAAAAAGEPAARGGRVDLDAIASDVAQERDHVGALALAQWIRYQRPGLRVIDIRPAADYQAVHIPTADNLTIEQASSIDAPADAPIVLYSEGGTHAAQVWFILRARGFTNVYFLREGLYEWVTRVLNPMLAIDATAAEAEAYARDAEMSRYFGGAPRRDVERSAIPDGYWLHEGAGHTGEPAPAGSSRSDMVDDVRRRGC